MKYEDKDSQISSLTGTLMMVDALLCDEPDVKQAQEMIREELDRYGLLPESIKKENE